MFFFWSPQISDSGLGVSIEANVNVRLLQRRFVGFGLNKFGLKGSDGLQKLRPLRLIGLTSPCEKLPMNSSTAEKN